VEETGVLRETTDLTQINKKTDNTNQQKDRQHKSTKKQTTQMICVVSLFVDLCCLSFC
jgi:6-phosphogluconolactonase (cycloisomerase 2 family)